MEKNCIICGGLMVKKPSESKKYWATKKMCSQKCDAIYRIGKPLPKPAMTQETRDKISATKKGNCGGEKHPMWKGGQNILNCKECGKEFKADKYRTKAQYCSVICKQKCKETGLAISKAKKGKFTNPLTSFQKGHKFSPETIQKISNSKKGSIPWNKKEAIVKNCLQCNKTFSVQNCMINQKCCSKICADKYRDKGKTTEAFRLRTSNKYKEWRTAVFQRDLYTCQECGQVGGKLNADHIKRFSEHPELRLDVDNGRTLCEDCHRDTPTFGNRQKHLKTA